MEEEDAETLSPGDGLPDRVAPVRLKYTPQRGELRGFGELAESGLTHRLGKAATPKGCPQVQILYSPRSPG